MAGNHLRNQVIIKISDPWDLGVLLKWEPLPATIISSGNKAIVLRLIAPFQYKKTSCEYFVASARHEGTSIDELRNGKTIFCALTRITEEQANSENPTDLSKWRGGLGIIGDVEPFPEGEN
jgi:hypothetical protein